MKFGETFKLAWTLTLSIFSVPSIAATYYLPLPGEQIVGEIQAVAVAPGDTLLKIARRYGVGHDAIIAANPNVDPSDMKVGQTVIVPTQHILPDTSYEGIVVNLPEMRLYYYPPPLNGKPAVVSTYPLGIGKEGYDMPPFWSLITRKRYKPVWAVPPSIRAQAKAAGNPLDQFISPGPSNPLGDYSMRLGNTSYLIHSTNKPYTIGQRVSHGCLRMYPEDIEVFFPMVPKGTLVQIVNQPIKVGWRNGEVYMEAHVQLKEENLRIGPTRDDLVTLIATSKLAMDERPKKEIEQIKREKRGIPIKLPNTEIASAETGNSTSNN